MDDLRVEDGVAWLILALATFPQPGVVAGESSLFAPAHLGVGLTPDCGLSLLLPEVFGLRAALDMVLHDRGVGAEKAVELGLAHELVADRLMARLDVEARTIARRSETPACRALIDSFVASRRRK